MHPPHHAYRRAAAAMFPGALVVALGSCGLGAGSAPTGVTLTVTEGHGAHLLVDQPRPKIGGADTVLRLLQRNSSVKTRYGGAFVTSIAGHGADGDGDWFYWVNGVAADRGAASWELRSGERVWWDRGASNDAPGVTPAVVGSYPAPLVGGYDSRAASVRVRCAEPHGAACSTVKTRLAAAGARLAGDAAAGSAVSVVVSPATAIGGFGREARALLKGPRASGVYLRADPSGTGLQALDDTGAPVGAVGRGAGVIAATRLGTGAPVWFVTGADPKGVRRAAKSLDADVLARHLAVVVDATGVRGLPETAR